MVRAQLVAVLAASAVALLLGLTGCGGPDRLDRAAIEAEVAEAVAPVAGPGVEEVVCPEPIDREADAQFACTVEVADGLGAFEASVRQVDDDGELAVEPLAVVVSLADVQAELAVLVEEQLDRRPEVSCGRGAHRLVEVGTTFPCRAQDGDERRSIDVTIEDGAGSRSYEVLPPGN